MLFLQCFDRFDDICELDLASGRFLRHSKREHPSFTSQLLQGSVSRLGEHLVSLYRHDDELYLRVDATDYELTDNTSVELHRGQNNVLTIRRQGTPILSIAYARSQLDPPIDTALTPFVEEEDFDFGLFVYTVVKDKGRKNRIYR